MESGFLHCEAIPLCRRLQTLKHLGMGFDGLGHFWGVVFVVVFVWFWLLWWFFQLELP